MGEKLYRPIMRDDEHLVKSRNNPNRVRGQARDLNNKNPDFIEFEEVDGDQVIVFRIFIS